MKISLVLAFLVALLTLSACQEGQFTDIDAPNEAGLRNNEVEVQVSNPDSITVYRNINMHPNLAVVCIEGVAFVTHSREAPPLRVEDLDGEC